MGRKRHHFHKCTIGRRTTRLLRWAVLAACVATTAAPPMHFGWAAERNFANLAELGEALFSDRNLSINRRQNCVSCHSPELAFSDPRELGELRGAVSRGSDLSSLGDRNSPTLMYASAMPVFHFARDGAPVGGMFHDGRVATLEDQAGIPLLDPAEMAMPDKVSVVGRLKENPSYVRAFESLVGAGVLEETDKGFQAMSMAIAAFQRQGTFAPFDSRYDRSLRGKAEFTALETRGRDLFFATGGCAVCHSSGIDDRQTFSNGRYYNLGVPANPTVRALNGSKPGRIDHGILNGYPRLGADFDGKFKVPTLRNVAVTGPYMHNGVFQELKTAIRFHMRFAAYPADAGINPETHQPWALPEVPATVDRAAIAHVGPVDAVDVDALAAFLQTLTDQRYERLLAKP